MFEIDLCEDTLQNIRDSYRIFKNTGYINDEDSSLGSHIFEHKTSLMDKLYRELGYDGDRLICYGNFYSGYGAVYWIIDERIISYQESKKLTERWVESRIDK